jgi:hypothetical protein
MGALGAGWRSGRIATSYGRCMEDNRMRRIGPGTMLGYYISVGEGRRPMAAGGD